MLFSHLVMLNSDFTGIRGHHHKCARLRSRSRFCPSSAACELCASEQESSSPKASISSRVSKMGVIIALIQRLSWAVHTISVTMCFNSVTGHGGRKTMTFFCFWELPPVGHVSRTPASWECTPQSAEGRGILQAGSALSNTDCQGLEIQEDSVEHPVPPKFSSPLLLLTTRRILSKKAVPSFLLIIPLPPSEIEEQSMLGRPESMFELAQHIDCSKSLFASVGNKREGG